VAVRAIVLQINEYTPELASIHMPRVPTGPRVITPRLEATSVDVAVVEAKAAAESAGESGHCGDVSARRLGVARSGLVDELFAMTGFHQLRQEVPEDVDTSSSQ
jgi:hypothetical protein